MPDPAILQIAALANRRRREVVRNYKGKIVVGASNGLARGTAEVFDHLQPIVQALSASLASDALPRGQLRELNRSIAAEAQRAMVAGFKGTLPERSAPYRPGDRLTGTLERALGDPAMLEGTTDRTISFVNTEHLNAEARHWYRINYGVSGQLTQGPSREAQTITVSVNNQQIMTLRDPNRPAAGGIFLPRFYHFDGRQMTIARGRAKPQTEIAKTRGARAAHFIDVGLATVAARVGPAYTTLLRSYVGGDATRRRAEQVMARRDIVMPDLRLLPDASWTVTIR